jgi:predicted Zn-dependent protease
MGMIEQFEAMLERGQDSPLLRFGLGNAYLKAGDSTRAIEHLRAAVAQDPVYSAAWKALGGALAEARCAAEAIIAYEQGIRVAEDKGDLQAAKEMRVFVKRLRKVELDGNDDRSDDRS